MRIEGEQPAQVTPQEFVSVRQPDTGLRAQLEHTRRTAERVARKLVIARGEGPHPTEPGEFMDMIESMLRTPMRWGVRVMSWERKAVLKWHAVRRLVPADK